MDFGAFKRQLADQAENQAEWRDQKAAEYPDDKRNRTSAESLRSVAAGLRNMPDDHSSIRRLWRLWHGLKRPGEHSLEDDALPGVEVEHELLRVWGFQNEGGDAEAFLNAYADALEKEIRDGS